MNKKNKPLPCVIFKSMSRLFKDSYDIGWLVFPEGENNNPYILKWGNTKNRESIDKFVVNMIEEQGERLIILYNDFPKIAVEHDSRHLIEISVDEYNNILFGNKTEILHTDGNWIPE
jgi:hypothetical protein